MRIPELLHHKASGRFYVNWRKKRAYFGRDEQEANRLHQAWLVDHGFVVPLTRITLVSDLLLFGLRQSREEYPRVSNEWTEHDQMCNAVRAAAEFFPDGMTMAELGPLALKRFRDHLIKKPVSIGYASKQVHRIRRIVGWAIGLELLPQAAADWLNHTPKAARGSAKRKRRQPVEDSVIDRTLPLLNPVVGAMVRLQRLTGARPQNVCNLTADQLDRETFAGLGVWVYWPRVHKMDHEDRDLAIMFGPKAQEILAPVLSDRAGDAPVFSPQDVMVWIARIRRERRRTPLTPSQLARTAIAARKRPPGAAYTSRTYRTAIQRAVARYNAAEMKAADSQQRDPDLLPEWTPHQIRHLRASELRSTSGLEAAQVTLGHSRADVTAIYTHRDLLLAARIACESG